MKKVYKVLGFVLIFFALFSLSISLIAVLKDNTHPGMLTMPMIFSFVLIILGINFFRKSK